MANTTQNALAHFRNWSVKGWSVQFELVTLNLMHFMITAKEEEEAYYRASWRFVRPSRVTFSKFTASTKAVIEKIHVSRSAKGFTTYRLEFEGDSFIEIVARECATAQW
jgi:hypothetical protein